MSERQNIVLDTNVLIDAFVRGRDIRHRASAELLRQIGQGRYQGILPTPVLVETYYVVIDVTHDPDRARKVLHTLLGLQYMQIVSISKEHALQAMEFFRDTNYFPMGSTGKLGRREEGLSIVDALILGVGRSMGAIVCSNENRFQTVKGARVKRPWEIVDILIEEKA